MRTEPVQVATGARGLLAALLVSAWACTPLHAALQGGAGQFTLLTQARPLDEVLESPGTSRLARRLLPEVEPILRFGEQHGLARTGSYRRYTELHRPAAVWVVSACAALSFTPKTWWFPIAGSFPYLGWFDRRAAREFAASLESDALDVELRPARAYSTLGWFDDPILSSMLVEGPEGPGALADVLLHESTHATLHVAGQAPFNESLASFVGERLSRAWLLEAFGPRSAPLRAWDLRAQRRAGIDQGLGEAARTLDALYRSAATDAEKRSRKAALLEEVRARLRFSRPLNNATLQSHLTYQGGAEGFARLLDSCAGAWPCFWTRLRSLTPASFGRPQQDDVDAVLDRLR